MKLFMIYLITIIFQVMLIFGICGCLRCNEILHLKTSDVEDLGGRFLVTVSQNKNDYSGQFIIGNLFYDKVKKYIELRPKNVLTDRFFIYYGKGKCTIQPIGIHKIGEVPRYIAEFLHLPHAERFTGHCFRRTSATLASDSGADMHMIKQLGRWRSDAIAEGYIENSLYNRELIYNKVIQQNSTSNPNNIQLQTDHSMQSPSTSYNLQHVSIQPQHLSIPSTSHCQLAHAVSVPLKRNTVQIVPTLGDMTLQKNHESNDENLEINWTDFEENFELPSSTKDTSKKKLFIINHFKHFLLM